VGVHALEEFGLSSGSILGDDVDSPLKRRK
jgi:hypothetical protein